MFETGGRGMFEKMFSWGKKEKPEEDLTKLSDQDLESRAQYTLTSKPDNEAARVLEKRKQQKEAMSSSARPESKPAEPKVKPVEQAEYIPPQQTAPRLKYKPGEKIIDVVNNGKGEFVTDADKVPSASAIKHESDSFIIHADNVPKQFNSDRQLEPGSDNRLVRQGKGAVARQYEQGQYQPRPFKGLIESGQGKEVILRPKMEVAKTEKIKPVIPPVEIPKKPEEDKKFEKKLERVQLADIDAIVESYAQRVAEKKLGERKEGANFATRWVVRLAEDGYYKKYFDEAKQEIMKNRNLLSQIETRWFKKSEGVPLRADATDIHYEILDKVVEAFDQKLLEERSTEVKAEHVRNMNVDLEAGRLFADFAMGRIADRAQFDRLVEERVVPNVPGAKTGERMYASNLYALAEKYRQEVDNHMRTVGKEMGPEQEAYVRTFFEKTLSLDIQLGEKNRDMAQRLPGDSMKGYEKFVDLTQNGFFKGNSKVGRAVGRFVANPITYAAVGGLTARGLTKGAAVGILSAVTFGSASAVIVGTGIGAGIYMGFRAARERRRDIMKGEKEAVLGQKSKETHELKEARDLISQVDALQAKGVPLTNEEKQQVAEIRASLRLQTDQKVDLISVAKDEGGRAGTKFIAETDLRAALNKFWEAKKGEFGATAAEQQRAYDRLVGDAEARLLPEIERVNKEVAKEIRNRGIKMGLVGGAAAALMTGVMGGYVTRGIEHAHDKIFGGNWSGNKATWLEALGDKLGVNHLKTDFYHGGISDHAPGFMHGHAELNLPAGYAAHDILDHGNHFLNLTGPDGHVIPGAEHIAVGPDGKILDPHVFDNLRSQGWNIKESVATTRTSGTSGGSGSGSPFHLNKVHRVDWHDEAGPQYSTVHGKSILYEGKQQELFLKDTGTGVKADVHMMAKNLIDNIQHKFADFGQNPDSSVDTKLSGLETKLMEWYNHGGIDEVQSHLKINIIPTSADSAHGLGMVIGGAHNGEIDLSSLNSVLKVPGATLHDGGLGVRYMEVGVDDGSGFHVFATASGHDAIMPAATEGIAGTESSFYTYDLRPKVDPSIEYPFPLAGNKRELQKDADKNTKDRLNRLNPKKPTPPEQPKEPVKGSENPTTPVPPTEGVKPPSNGEVKPPVVEVPPVVVNNTEKPVQETVSNSSESAASVLQPENNPEANSRESAEAKEKILNDLRSGLQANNLKQETVFRAAELYNVSRVDVLLDCLDYKKINYEQEERKIRNGNGNFGLNLNREQILWQILEHSMVESPKTKGPEIKKASKNTEPSPSPKQAPEVKNVEPEQKPVVAAEQVKVPEPSVETPKPVASKEKEERPDLAETLTGKFSKINVNVTGQGQNNFAASSERGQQRTVEAYERGLKVINEKLEKAGVKNKIKLEIGGKFLDGPKTYGVPIGTGERGIIRFLTDRLQEHNIISKEKVENDTESDPKKKLQNQNVRPGARLKS